MNTHNKPVHARNGPNTDRDTGQMQAGADLRAAMEAALSAKQMTVSALAREADVQRADIYRWWRGETRPSRNSLARVANTLGIDVAYLRQALGQVPPVRTETDPLVSAIRELVGAINALVGRLDVLTAGQATAAGEMMHALGALGARLNPPGMRPEGEREARGGTGR